MNMQDRVTFWPRLPKLRSLSFLLAWFLGCQLVSISTANTVRLDDDAAVPQILQASVKVSTSTRTNGAATQSTSTPSTVQAVLDAIRTMQDEYFEIFTGAWPTAIDWTSAVMSTYVSATLSSLVTSVEYSSKACAEVLAWENIVDKYFAQTSVFYFGENAFALRNQAYDDMLWVVLGWLESIKFMNLRKDTYWGPGIRSASEARWHGLQFSPLAAHRARIFYDLASNGWDTSLCQGGMNWNPRLAPYKNAITNELFISASVAMYLYFPGDDNESPYLTSSNSTKRSLDAYKPHNPMHLLAAINAYQWLHDSGMKNECGLFADGFHIQGWRKYPNGTVSPGTGNCDELNSMVYTYNQGVILTANRGLWISTGNRDYLEHGHSLVKNVIRATGWPTRADRWHGLGRNGVLEEFCDHAGRCSQDGQTFKGIFFHHLAEFCRPLWTDEEEFMNTRVNGGLDRSAYQYHQLRCAGYGPWIKHNAQAALDTRDEKGRFGMWWGRAYPDTESHLVRPNQLRPQQVDYRNAGVPKHADSRWQLEKAKVTEDDMAASMVSSSAKTEEDEKNDVNDRGRGRTVETQSGGLAVLRALWQWESIANNEQKQHA
jgi:hypothetical protein